MNHNEDPSLKELLLLFRHRDIETRWRAASAICRCGNKAVEPLMMSIYDNDQSVRILAIWALGKIGDKRAVGMISRSLHDDNDLVQMASEGALSRLNRV